MNYIKILIENGTYDLSNHGDIAMLQVVVSRLREMLPLGHLHVMTDYPAILAKLVPEAVPLSNPGCHLFNQPWNIFGAVHKLAIGPLSGTLADLERGMRRFWPSYSAAWISHRMCRRGHDVQAMNEYISDLTSCDALVVSGGGFITDAFEQHSLNLLESVSQAKRLGKPVALFGQGIGPIRSKKLLRSAMNTLSKVDLISLREARRGLPLLHSLGVDPGRIVVTGDDAIELAYRNRDREPRDAIGFNLRLAAYSGVGDDDASLAFGIVEEIARQRGVRVRPVPITFGAEGSDVSALRSLGLFDNGFDTTEDIIRQVARCHLVVTGSYHAGVFALAQGKPVVAIAKSHYYEDKFLGLADEFGCGCEVVMIDEEFPRRLRSAIEAAWSSIDAVQEPLLRAAEKQIFDGRAAYSRFSQILAKGGSRG